MFITLYKSEVNPVIKITLYKSTVNPADTLSTKFVSLKKFQECMVTVSDSKLVNHNTIVISIYVMPVIIPNCVIVAGQRKLETDPVNLFQNVFL